eukprot:CAMPEP_0194483472 /NCGR_PEP_ID=MMETSP0253-20130528/5068_1 /TAXON_ID=2966 /ORGANISM="Noctiluca scintillans" /LENGTH=136 /DNA_ID=CAMNT_0039323135 /DNA_START=172 /DNA_END=582 /DNA_ORIENTATION=-
MSQTVTDWMRTSETNGGWQDNFCDCVQNGHVAGWYQQSPMLYLLEDCSTSDGFVMRTGHLQDRYIRVLQAQMSCDVLKLLSYCIGHSEEVLVHWNTTCEETRYSVPSCDVDCSGAQRGLPSSAVFVGFVAMGVWDV